MNKVIEQNLNQSNKIMFYVIPLLLLMSFGLIFFNDTLTEFLFIGLPAALIPMFLIKYNPLNIFTRYSVAASFMIFAALQIHQMHGMIEMHFGIFVLLAFLIVYKDIITNLIGAAVIAVHHLSFYYLQSSGSEIYVVSPENLSFPLILIHAGFVVAETIILCIIASAAYKDMKINADLQGAIDKTIKENGNICLNNLCELEDVEITSKYNVLIERLQNTIDRKSTRLNSSH